MHVILYLYMFLLKQEAGGGGGGRDCLDLHLFLHVILPLDVLAEHLLMNIHSLFPHFFLEHLLRKMILFLFHFSVLWRGHRSQLVEINANFWVNSRAKIQ